MKVRCPFCQKQYSVRDTLTLATQIACQQCGQTFGLSEAFEASAGIPAHYETLPKETDSGASDNATVDPLAGLVATIERSHDYRHQSPPVAIAIPDFDPPPVQQTVVVVDGGGMKNSGVAAILCFFWPGLGQFYNGHFGKGLLFFFCWPVVLFLCLGAFFGISILPGALAARSGSAFAGLSGSCLLICLSMVALALLWAYPMVDAYKSAEKINARRRRNYGVR